MCFRNSIAMAESDNKTGATPPNIAVALKYAEGTDSAPKISASGRGTFAEQLIELARANGVKIREDADLAQVLTVFDVDNVIPIEALDAVSEILAYVYRANGEQFDPDGTVSREWAKAIGDADD
jgi:flagellar biosynthesis protein